MRIIKSIILFFVMMALITSSAAWAGGRHFHHRSHVGIYLGVPLVVGAGYYAAPSYYYPAPGYFYGYPNVATVYGSAGIPATSITIAPTYIERAPQQETGQDPSGYWYYCNSPQGYYPNVAQCPSGWQKVAPRR